MSASFSELIVRLKGAGARFVTLGEVAESLSGQAPDAPLSMGELPGRAGLVAIQG